MDDGALLEANFTLFPKDIPNVKVTLTRRGIRYVRQDNGANKTEFVGFADVVGCDCLRGKRSSDQSAYFCLYSYPHRRKAVGKKTLRRREVVTFKANAHHSFIDNFKVTDRWRRCVFYCLRNVHFHSGADIDRLPPLFVRRFLVLINPFSGPGKALQIFQNQITPMLGEAGIHFNLIITERAGHAREMMASLKPEEWSGILIVSGDGLIFEVVNGLMARPDWQKAIKIPIGALPGGSGNALSCETSFFSGEPFKERQVLHSTFLVAKHHVHPLDLVAVDTVKQRLYSFLSVSWGMASDIDIESEKYRSLGNARFTVTGIEKILGMRTYRGRLSFLPVGDYHPKPRPQSMKDQARRGSLTRKPSVDADDGLHGTYRSLHTSVSYSEGMLTASQSETNLSGLERIEPSNGVQVGSLNGFCYSSDQMNGHVNGCHLDGSGDGALIPTPLLVPLDQPVPENWVTIEDDFVSFFAAFLSHLGPDLYVVRNKEWADGQMYLTFVRAGVPRATLLGIFIAMADGTALDSPWVEQIPVKAFRLEPLTDRGVIAVDGERVDYGPIQAQVLGSVARVFVNPKRQENTTIT